MLCVGFLQVQYIDFKWDRSSFENCRHCDISEHLNLSSIFVVNHFLIAKVSPQWRLIPGFGSQKKCWSPLNKGIPSKS